MALKVLPAGASDPERLQRFRREAETLAALSHPNIVTLHSVEEDEGVHFITMELVEGTPLDRVIERRAAPPDPDLRDSPSPWPARWPPPTTRGSSTAT